MLDEETSVTGQSGEELRAALMRARSTNSVLQRLQSRVLASADVSEVITSYDRMHHRHSRS